MLTKVYFWYVLSFSNTSKHVPVHDKCQTSIRHSHEKFYHHYNQSKYRKTQLKMSNSLLCMRFKKLHTHTQSSDNMPPSNSTGISKLHQLEMAMPTVLLGNVSLHLDYLSTQGW